MLLYNINCSFWNNIKEVQPINCFIFNGFSSEETKNLIKLFGTVSAFVKGDELYKNGSLGIILNGTGTVKRYNAIGDSITIRNITDNEAFGAASMFGCWKDGMSSIIANTKGEILYISENDFCDIIKIYPQIAINYISYLSNRIRFLNYKLDTFTAKTTEEKLYEYLLSLSDADGNITLNISITELARRINVGRTSIYRDISELEAKKLIKRNGRKFKIKK